jgi:hypothetical protein
LAKVIDIIGRRSISTERGKTRDSATLVQQSLESAHRIETSPYDLTFIINSHTVAEGSIRKRPKIHHRALLPEEGVARAGQGIA